MAMFIVQLLNLIIIIAMVLGIVVIIKLSIRYIKKKPDANTQQNNEVLKQIREMQEKIDEILKRCDEYEENYRDQL